MHTCCFTAGMIKKENVRLIISIQIFRSDLEPSTSEVELFNRVDNIRLSETCENKFSDKDLNINAGVLAMPKPIRKSILKQNVKFLHNRLD